MENRLLIAATALMLACASFAQRTAVAPPPPVKTEAEAQQAPQAVLYAAIACVDADGNRSVRTLAQWQAMPMSEKQKIGKAGIDVRYDNQHFTIGLRDLASVPLDYVGGQVPSAAQWTIINNNLPAINRLLEAIGGDPIDPSLQYWSKGEKNIGLKTARLCAQGSRPFADTVMHPVSGEGYEIVGETVDGISVGICNERYGYVDGEGNCVVPAKYEYLSIYGPACENGLYGMIDLKGNAVVPFIYDGMIPGKHLSVVFQEGACGAFDAKGLPVIPIEYAEIIPGKSKPSAMVGNGNAFALADAKGLLLTPFIYDRVVSAQDCGFAVGRDGKSIYLGLDGKEYGNANDMTMGVLGKSANPEDQYALAKQLYDRKKYFDAMKYARAAASAGYAPAQCLMGHFYADGRGSASKSDSKAFEWYEKAAKQGLPEACYYLSKMYENGRGVYRNAKLAAEWLDKANGFTPNKQ